MRRCFISMLIVASLAIPAHAQSPSDDDDWTNFSKDALSSYVETMQSSGRIPAMAFAVIHREKGVILAKGFGKRLDESDVDANTPFVLGDLSRAVLLTAAMHQFAEGKGSIDPKKLVSMTDAELSKRITSESGLTLDKALAANLWTPLGMTASGTRTSTLNAATGHQYLFGFPIPRPEADNTEASEPYMASVADLGRFLVAHLRAGKTPEPKVEEKPSKKRKRRKPKDDEYVVDTTPVPLFLPPERFAILHQPSDEPTAGWHHSTGDQGPILTITGPTANSSAAISIVPEKGLAVVVMANVNSLNAHTPASICNGLVELLFTRKTTALPWVEFWLRIAMGMGVLFALFSLLQNGYLWWRSGFPREMDIGRRAGWLALFVVLPLVVMVAVLVLIPPAQLVATQPDIALAVLIGCPAASIRGVLKQWVKARQEEIMNTFQDRA